MKYILLILLLTLVMPPSLYIYSFAKYSWRRDEKLAAVGAALLGTASMFLPALLLLIR
jgi:hypothetical protein